VSHIEDFEDAIASLAFSIQNSPYLMLQITYVNGLNDEKIQ